MTKTSQKQRDKIVDAALLLAAEKPWQTVTLANIAKQSGFSLSVVQKNFRTTGDILAAYIDRVDQEMLAHCTPHFRDEPAQEKLFDLMMTRFELMQPHRATISSIVKSTLVRPDAGIEQLYRLRTTIQWMMEAAGLSTSGFRSAVWMKLLGAVYLFALRAFIKDQSQDLSKTMAATDKALKKLDRVDVMLQSCNAQKA